MATAQEFIDVARSQVGVRTYGRRGSSWWIAGFGRPAWSAASSAVSTGSEAVKAVQRWLNFTYGAGLAVDGQAGKNTFAALLTC